MMLLILTLIFLIGVSLSFQCIAVSDLKLDGYRMVTSVFKTLEGLPIYSCVSECLSTPKCKSFSYSENYRVCQLAAEDGFEHLQADTEFFHSNVSDWPRSLGGPCEGVLCSYGDKCSVDRFGNPSCVKDAYSGCDFPIDLPNANKTSSGLFIGSVTRYTCKTDYLFCGSSSVQTCSALGTWEGLMGACRRAVWTNSALTFSESVPCDMNEEYKVIVEGIPTAEARLIKITLRTTTDVQLQFLIQFNFNTYVKKSAFHSMYENTWETEITSNFPFAVGIKFLVEIRRENGRYQVYENGSYYGGIRDRSPAVNPTDVIIDNDILLQRVEFINI